MESKKAISPVVATALLIVVAVVSVVGFQNWFMTYQSALLSDTETRSGLSGKIIIDGIIGEKLYLRSEELTTVDDIKIMDNLGNQVCMISDTAPSSLQADTYLLVNFDSENADDYSGYENNMTCSNCPVYTTEGISGGAYVFDGLNDRFITPATTVAPVNELTLLAWVYPTDMSSFDRGIIVKDDAFSLEIESDTSCIDFCVYQGTFDEIAPNDCAISLNEWTHMAATFDGVDLKVYQNGILVGEQATAKTFMDNPNTPYYIGYNPYAANRYFEGTLDEIAVYSKALTAEEITELYEAQKAKLYEQIITSEMNEIDISSCNLNSGSLYEIVVITDSGIIQQKILAQ